MNETTHSEAAPMKNPTTIEKKSDREVFVTRTFNGPAHIVYKAWTTPELFKRWWAPKSLGMTLRSCEMDVRTGGSYRLVMKHPSFEQPMAFFGRYIEVVPNARIVWTNDEGGEGGQVTTVTFEAVGETTRLTLSELYPSKEAFAASEGSADGLPEQFEQLDALLLTLV